jgi:hypothetical protein
MRSSTLSGPVGGFGGMLAFWSTSGPRVEECREYVLVCVGFGSGAFSGESFLSVGGVGTVNWGVVVGGLNCEMPAATAVLVCTHRRYGLECMTILRFFLGRCVSPSAVPLAASNCSVSRWCSSAAIRRPSARPWAQPPYVRGGS